LEPKIKTTEFRVGIEHKTDIFRIDVPMPLIDTDKHPELFKALAFVCGEINTFLEEEGVV
jgi:hypothetical protein|tara:strand:- start:879 stop:1058 length:180 start_codon:yes stop_codon:yes gene_type:complete